MSALAVVGIFVWVVGLCIGSFLNVVIYRLPAGLSVTRPTWSFCPACRAVIHWYDNLPVLSWLLLRGRCRRCGAAISPRYPLVEALTGFALLLVFHLLFVERARVGLDEPAWPADLPLLLSWLVLTAALIACSGMDLAAYIVDTLVLYTAIAVGLVAHVLWPRPEFMTATVDNGFGAAAAAAFVASVVMLWLTVWREAPAPEHEEQGAAEPVAGGGEREQPVEWTVAIVALIAFVGLAVWLIALAAGGHPSRVASAALAVPAGLVAVFAATVLAASQPREADAEIRHAIEEEAPHARRVALREMVWLAGILLPAVVVYALVAFVPAAGAAWSAAVRWTVGESLVPLAGAAFAMHGAIVAATAGWIVRLVFTLIFGREAFATGDIFILAAAGAAAGWDIALLGFLLSVLLATAGWLLGLLLKRTGMIPFGPWLTIGFVMALWLNEPAARVAENLAADLATAARQRPETLMLMTGVMLIGGVAAVYLARLVRRLVEPESS